MNSTDSPPIDQQTLVDVMATAYRSIVVRRLGPTADWEALEWTDFAECAGQSEVTLAMCQRCPVTAECFAAAIATGDRAELRGGITRAQRDALWERLEATYSELQDPTLLEPNPPVSIRLHSQLPSTNGASR